MAIWNVVIGEKRNRYMWIIQMEETCSRCKQPIKNFSPPESGNFTAGYYVAQGWLEFSNPGEVYICDDCMWKDPRYISVYGIVQNG